ncbi:MAG: Hpt domain-containing protein [Desulfobacterales bacterium]|nr:Hpt domain-containing protein [Desulfobacterales bacterium]
MTDQFDQETVTLFLSECDEMIEKLENDLFNLESNPNDESIINSIFRCYHSIKGGDGMLGWSELSHYTHQVENCISKIRDEKIALPPQFISVCLECITTGKTFR